jgi:phosphate acyltransferase
LRTAAAQWRACIGDGLTTMATPLVIAIDGMGGDHAPESVIGGLDLVARRMRDVRFLVHGDGARLESLLNVHPAAKAACTVRSAERALGMDVKPSQAMRQGRGSSLWNAIVSVEEGEAAAVVSAGNTGALMAIAMLRLRKMQGIHRPALVASWPTLRGISCVLDVGANVEADATQLVEFAIMGEAFFRAVHGAARPSIGLLNVGSEDEKGHEQIRQAAVLMRESGVELDFRGFVEGDDIGKGTVDVVVTDGFAGNIALKTAEGTARQVGGYLKEALSGGPLARIGALFAYPALRRLKAKMDPGRVNGGVFLGLNGLVVKSHGGADAGSFASAVKVALSMARSSYRTEIETQLAKLAAAPAPTAAAGGAS